MNYTKGKWEVEHSCGCITSVLGDGEDAVQTISYCPKHKAAPDMYEALEDNEFERGMLKIAIDTMTKALAKAERKE